VSFNRAVGEDRVDHCGIIGVFEGQNCLEISNRYFTPCKEVPHEPEIQFSSDVDPYGNLKQAAGSSLIHCEENVVQYFDMKVTQSGDTR